MAQVLATTTDTSDNVFSRCFSMPDNLAQLALDISAFQEQLVDTERDRMLRCRSVDRLSDRADDDDEGLFAMDDDDDDDLQDEPLKRRTTSSSPHSPKGPIVSESKPSFLPGIIFYDDDDDDENDDAGMHAHPRTLGLPLQSADELDSSAEKYYYYGNDKPIRKSSIRIKTKLAVDGTGFTTDNKLSKKTISRSSEAEAASACINELLAVIGANMEEITETKQDGLKKSPCSVIPNPHEAPETRSDEHTFTSRFFRLSSDRRANSMPLQRQSNSSSRSPIIPSMPRKSSLKSISSLSTSQSNNSFKRNVSFNKLLIREYSIELSDHPSCSCGPPIQLGWDYRDKASVAVEDYEERRLPRRNSNELILSYNVRRYLLLKRAGYSKQELKRVMDEVNKVKRERLVTDFLMPVMKIDETIEEVMDHIKATFSVKKKRERQMSLPNV